MFPVIVVFVKSVIALENVATDAYCPLERPNISIVHSGVRGRVLIPPSRRNNNIMQCNLTEERIMFSQLNALKRWFEKEHLPQSCYTSESKQQYK